MRERYALIVLLLFFPYRSVDDLMLNDSYWEKYLHAVKNNQLSAKSLEVIQNIQDVSYNCSGMRKAKDELKETTKFTPHEKDSDTRCKVDDNTTDIIDIVELFQQLDDTGLEDSNPEKKKTCHF